jgi:hypothetical protein
MGNPPGLEPHVGSSNHHDLSNTLSQDGFGGPVARPSWPRRFRAVSILKELPYNASQYCRRRRKESLINM